MAHVSGFSVNRRNPGHWDVWSVDNGLETARRLFRIRGGPGKYIALDERERGAPNYEFKTLSTCMQFICDELMHELIVAEGQEPTIIEKWNVR